MYPGESYQGQPYSGQPYPGQPYPGQVRDWAVPREAYGAPVPTPRSGGTEGNERLTAMTGAILLVLLAAEGVTILSLGQLLTWHFFIGMLLLGPVSLKAGSTIYRFARYYSGHPEYKRKGPPAPLLRLLGPCIVLLTAGVFGSGIMLAIDGPAGRGQWLFIHKASFVLWIGAMTIHVLAYVWRLPRLLGAEARGVSLEEGHDQYGGGRPARRAAQILGGRGTRVALLAASLLGGLVIALLTVHLAAPWQSQFGFIPGK